VPAGPWTVKHYSLRKYYAKGEGANRKRISKGEAKWDAMIEGFELDRKRKEREREIEVERHEFFMKHLTPEQYMEGKCIGAIKEW